MVKSVTTVSDEGFPSNSSIREYERSIDPGGDDAPDTIESLLSAYAACYIPALRVGGQQRGVDDLGRVQIDVTGEVNDDGKLESITFDVTVDAALDDDTQTQIIDRANALCKVHDALKESVKADVSFT